MSVGSVFMAKANVLRMLREEIQGLDERIDAGAAEPGPSQRPPPIEDRPG